MPPESLIKVAVITGAHGIRGEIKLRSFLENPESAADISPLLDASGKPLFSLTITGKSKDGFIAKASGITDRNAAELLKGKELYAPASALPALADGEIYHSQLIGLEAKLQNGEVYGKITGIYNFGAGDVVEIATANGSEMLPFTAPWVDVKKEYVIITPPEYLESEKP